MARRRKQNRQDPPRDPPRWYRVEEVTIVFEPRSARVRDRVVKLGQKACTGVARARARVAVGALAAAAVAVTAALLATSLHDKRTARAAASPAAQARAAGAAGVAAAYRYPLNCLVVTLAVRDPTYARVRLNRASPCWRYGAYLTTIFHRVKGAWRLVLDAPSYSCPLLSIPPAVQAQLALCPNAGGPRVLAGRTRTPFGGISLSRTLWEISAVEPSS